ncbi:MAG TPA: D-alanine--D-alanine ligase family protein [Candidatus Acidoferrales bacterium]|jgi:D-alanine-D-alanine ligase|nr:D-alanine--D-alanine ligase family protein [Candidatus Acidoferrales bacterium]
MTSGKRLRVGVLFGGRSGEHEVSLASAASVIRALDPEKYEAVPIGISKDGRWLAGTKANQMLPEVLKKGERVSLPPDPTAGALLPISQGAGRPSIAVEVMFPVLHGTFGEDGTVQGLLELAGLPYVGAGVLGSAVGMDKDVQKRLFEQAGLPTVPFVAIRRSEWEQHREAVLARIKKKLKFPVFVKPATLGSSVGMSRVKNAGELSPAMDLAAEFALKIVVERGVNAREIEVSVLGNDDVKVSVPGEIVPHREYYDYAAKYLEQGTKLEIPAKLSKQQVAKFQELAVKAFQCIDGAGLARCDFFLEKKTNRIFVNELNTIPGFTAISMYPKLWEASGLSYPKLIDRLIELAFELHREKARTKYSIELPAGAAGALDA